VFIFVDNFLTTIGDKHPTIESVIVSIVFICGLILMCLATLKRENALFTKEPNTQYSRLFYVLKGVALAVLSVVYTTRYGNETALDLPLSFRDHAITLNPGIVFVFVASVAFYLIALRPVPAVRRVKSIGVYLNSSGEVINPQTVMLRGYGGKIRKFTHPSPQ
jgi:uncharacterized membrane protein